MNIEWISEKSWYIYEENFTECDETQFNKLWDLHNSFGIYYIKMFGKSIPTPRKQGLFADGEIAYSFSGCIVNSLKIPDMDILNTLREKLSSVDEYNALFFNWYKDGNDYICAHRDDESGMRTSSTIASVSLGANRIFRIRRYTDKKIVQDVTLKHGSLFIMGGDFQKEFTHEIPKTKKCVDKRINITLRCFE